MRFHAVDYVFLKDQKPFVVPDPSVRNVEPPRAPNPWEKTVAKNEEKKKKKELEEKKKSKKKEEKGFYSEEDSESSSGTSDSERYYIFPTFIERSKE